MDVNGNHVGGFIGSLRSVKSLVRDIRPDRVVVAWDGKGGSSKRRSIYADYKAGRKPRVNRHMDLDSLEESQANLKVQYARLRRYLDILGVCQIEVENTEADDLVAVLVQMFPGQKKYVVSTDRDFLQLVSDETCVYSPTKKVYYWTDEVKKEHGVLPENYIFVKAICGDGSDNVDGALADVKGLGPKTVVKFFPFLGEKPTTLQELKAAAQVLEPKGKREKELLKVLLERWEVVITNFRLMQLSSPIISPQSVRAVRYQVEQDTAPVNTTAFKLALLQDGLQLSDGDFFSTFNEYRVRFQNAREDSKNV